MSHPETHILKQNRFDTLLVDLYTDEKKAVIYKAPNRVASCVGIRKLLSNNFLKVCLLLKKTNKYAVYFSKQKRIISLYNEMSFPSILWKSTKQ